MSYNEYGIDLVDRLNALLDRIKDRADIIVPIERKGIKVLELSKYADTLFSEQRILYYNSVFFHAQELRNKRIVLFDESVNTGRSLADRLNDLKKLSIKKKLGLDIKTAALLVNETVTTRPNIYLKDLVCDQVLYDYLSDELIFNILSSGKPLDVDHPIVTIQTSEEDPSKLNECLNEIAYTRILDHSLEFDNVTMYTMDFRNKFDIPDFETYPKLLDDGPKKIRLFQKGNTINCIPIVYPFKFIADLENCQRKIGICDIKCDIKEINQKDSFCKIINIENTLETDEKKIKEFKYALCYQCIVYELSCRLLGSFLYQLRDKIRYEFKGLEKRNLCAVYHTEGIELASVIEQKIKRYMTGEEKPVFYNKKAEDCELTHLPTQKCEYLIDGVRMETEIVLGITKNVKTNKELFNHSDYDSTYPHIGLSYNQILEMFNDRDEHDVSAGIDIALDIGEIKPIVPPLGIKVSYQGKEMLGITRLYCTASENIDRSMAFLSRILTRKEPVE